MWTARYCADHVGLERIATFSDALNLSSPISKRRIDKILAYDADRDVESAAADVVVSVGEMRRTIFPGVAPTDWPVARLEEIWHSDEDDATKATPFAEACPIPV